MWRLGAGAQRASDAAQPCDQPGPGRVDGRTATMTATGRGVGMGVGATEVRWASMRASV